MKNIITTAIIAPIALSIVSVVLLMLSNILQHDQMTWAIWGVTVFSAFCSLLIISVLCSFWFAQWLTWQVKKQLHVKKKSMKNLSQYSKALPTN